jgi:hypothetical protein
MYRMKYGPYGDEIVSETLHDGPASDYDILTSLLRFKWVSVEINGDVFRIEVTSLTRCQIFINDVPVDAVYETPLGTTVFEREDKEKYEINYATKITDDWILFTTLCRMFHQAGLME